MAIELKIPSVGESITDVEIGEWLKQEGDPIERDENLVAIESEKATVELPAPEAGTLSKILKRRGEKATVGEIIGEIEPVTKSDGPKEEPRRAEKMPPTKQEIRKEVAVAEIKAAAKTRPAQPAQRLKPEEALGEETEPTATSRLPKEEIQRPTVRIQERRTEEAAKPIIIPSATGTGREEEIIPMTPLRRTVAKRLVEAQQTMAMLTTFNEIDLSAVQSLRKEHQENFTKKFGVKLGLMSFFAKAAIDGLKLFPQLNASVRGDDIIYHNYFDIGMAISSGKGLVVPVLKNAERMSFAEIEKAIGDFATRAQENKLKPEELQGGTFTITNGGIFGSLLSTPIINPPQSGILGMHTIQERPVALNGNVVIRPMMYLALSYDHRIVDGREAVTFLRRVKEVLEEPARLLLEI